MKKRFFAAASAVCIMAGVLMMLLFRGPNRNYLGVTRANDTIAASAVWQEFFVYHGKVGFVRVTYDAGMSNVMSFGSRGVHWNMSCGEAPPIFAQAAVDEWMCADVDWDGPGFISRQPHYQAILIPFWAPLLLLGITPLPFAIGVVRRARRFRAGLCVKCGYNLNGNVSGLCAECGAIVADHPKTALATIDPKVRQNN